MEDEYPPRPPRKELLFYLDILDGYTHDQLGHLVNLSNQGMMIIITDNPISFEKGQVKKISIQLPDFEEFTKKFIEVQVEIRWTKQDSNPKFYRIGCHFVDIAPDELPIIAQVQDVLGF
jgi:c-di-GMP-binding flagellar brake protein YcgR